MQVCAGASIGINTLPFCRNTTGARSPCPSSTHVPNAPDGFFKLNSLSETGAVPLQGTYRPSNVTDCNSAFYIRHRLVLPSESVQQPNHQPRFQPNGTYGASSQTEVLGMLLGLRAFQLDHRINSPTTQAESNSILNATRMERFYISAVRSVYL